MKISNKYQKINRLKINLLLTVLVFTIQSFLYAQQYQTFNSNRTVLFVGPYNIVKALNIDSVHFQTDSILYPMKNIAENGFGCFNFNGPSWIGDKIHIKGNGDNIFFNRDNDSIIIKTHATLNDSWICYKVQGTSYIQASVASVSYENVLGINDSVKTIVFQKYDSCNVAVNHPINSLQIKISQNYGFEKTLNFYFFPDLQTNSWLNESLSEFSLIGIDNPMAGVQNLTWHKVFDFDVNDEFHTEYDFSHMLPPPSQSSNIKTTRKVITKLVSADTIIYTFERKQLSIQTNQNGTTSSTLWDTITSKIFPNQIFDNLPNKPLTVNFESFALQMCNGPVVSKIEPSIYQRFWNNTTDSCMNEIIADGCFPAYEYFEGLGGPFFSCSYFSTDESNTLVYYKKGSATWGNPLFIPVAFTEHKKEESDFEIFPTIVAEAFTVNTSDINTPYMLSILDVCGRVITEYQVFTNHRVFNNDLRLKGLYFYKINAKNDNKKNGKIIFLH